ncbi:MAG TPA: hypothetical protein VMP11_18370 [Verrucomicrobiae bacterium]|nr:hypothetical protein [Verrucomicrobiae bacterium]
MKTTQQRFITRLSGWVVVALLASGLAATSGFGGVFTPYTQTWDSGLDGNFAPGFGGYDTGSHLWTWGQVGTNGVYVETSVENDNAAWYGFNNNCSAIQVYNLGGAPLGATNFIESVTVTCTNDNPSGWQHTVGLGALSPVQQLFYYNGQTWIRGYFNIGGDNASPYTNGLVGIAFEANNYGSNMVFAPFPVLPTTNVTYTMTLTGNYDGVGNLTMSFTVTDGTNTTKVTAQPLPASIVPTGNQFGLYDYYWDGNAPGLIVDLWDNYSITTPPTVPYGQPASIALANGISWFASNAVNYQVQSATSTNGPWSNLGGTIFGNGTTNTVFDTGGQKVYRVVQ